MSKLGEKKTKRFATERTGDDFFAQRRRRTLDFGGAKRYNDCVLETRSTNVGGTDLKLTRKKGNER